ncbi:MAG: rhodanese-like domain-containing protein [Candidatus Limnocylindrales bacterium]
MSLPIRQPIPEIDVDELGVLMTDGGVRLLDVREEWEFRRRRVPGAVSLPLAQLPARIAVLPRGERLLVICEHGIRSRVATDLLLRNGFEGVVSVKGGTDAWARANRPLERD